MKVTFTPDMVVKHITLFFNGYNSVGMGRAQLGSLRKLCRGLNFFCIHAKELKILSLAWMASTETPEKSVVGADPSASIIHCSVFMFDWSVTAVSLPSQAPKQPHRKQAV